MQNSALLCIFVPFCFFCCAFLCVLSCRNGRQRSADLRGLVHECANNGSTQYPFNYTPFCMSPTIFNLSDPTEIPSYRKTPVARPCHTVFSVVSQTIAATPPLHSVKMAYRNRKAGLGGGGGYRRKRVPLKPIAL